MHWRPDHTVATRWLGRSNLKTPEGFMLVCKGALKGEGSLSPARQISGLPLLKSRTGHEYVARQRSDSHSLDPVRPPIGPLQSSCISSAPPTGYTEASSNERRARHAGSESYISESQLTETCGHQNKSNPPYNPRKQGRICLASMWLSLSYTGSSLPLRSFFLLLLLHHLHSAQKPP